MAFRPPYRYITANQLAALLHNSPSLPRKDIAIVDVRDDDFEGGNIVGCVNVPSTTFDDRVKTLAEKDLKDFPTVVFHCSLSQQRGPKSARIYSETRQSLLDSGKIKPISTTSATQQQQQRSTATSEGEQEAATEGGQQVLVLRDGFANFGRVYKDDAKLVEGYDEEAWAWR